MLTRIEIFQKPDLPDHVGEQILAEIHSLGIRGAADVRTKEVYLIEGTLSDRDIEKMCRELLADVIVQDFAFNSHRPASEETAGHTVEVLRKPGVMDPVEATAVKGIEDLGLEVKSLKRARQYKIKGELTQEELARFAHVRRETIVFLEQGNYNPSLKLAHDAATALKTTLEKLFIFN